MANTGTRGEALCVRVLWGERRVATHLLHPGDQLALASTGEPVPAVDAPLSFRTTAPGHFSLAFGEGVVGEVLRNGETPLTLGDAVHRGLAFEEKKGWSFDIGRADVLRLGRGPVSVEAFRVRAPPKAVGSLDDSIDYRFLNTLLVCLALFGVLAMQAQFTSEETIDDSVSSDVTRMRRILVQAQKPLPKKIASDTTPTPLKKTPVKRAPAEGSPRPPSKPVKDPGGSPSVVASNLVGRLFGGPGAAGVMGPGGLGKDLEGALGNVVAANGNGNGGWSIKGNGAGGPGGDPAQIGAIPRSGIAAKDGIGKLCHGPGPCKSSLAPPEITSEQILCADNGTGGQCMDKELIRKVIASHRDQVRFCYELALQQSPSLAGKVAVQFAVIETGGVATARIEQNTAQSATLGDCLVSRVRTWQFPINKRSAGFRVTYPFVFKPSGT